MSDTILKPVANGDTIEWPFIVDAYGGVDTLLHWTAVLDDSLPTEHDADTSRLGSASSTTPILDLFQMAAAPDDLAIGIDVQSVTVHMFVKRRLTLAGQSSVYVRAAIKENGVLTLGDQTSVEGGSYEDENDYPGAYYEVTHTWDRKPSDGSPFQYADLLAIQAGVQGLGAVDTNVRCTKLWLSVQYAPHVDLDPDNESVVGMVRESAWAATPVFGQHPDRTINGITFFPCKMESVQGDMTAAPQKDDMWQREVANVVRDVSKVQGPLRFLAGTESLGFFLTSMMGRPDTTTLSPSSGTDEGVYQHVWTPGRDVSTWPVSYSIESQFDSMRSKLIQGALVAKLPMFLANNGPIVCIPQVVGKRIVWLYPDTVNESGSGTTDERGNTRPAVMTANAPVIDEGAWHWRHMGAYPQLDGADEEMVRSAYIEPAFARLDSIFTAGSGLSAGTYGVDNFKLTGRLVMDFFSREMWETFELGLPFDISLTFTADVIAGGHREQLKVEAFGCKATENQIPNKTGDLTYDFAWHATGSPSCRFTIINTVSSY